MAKKKAPTRQADTEPADESLERARRHLENVVRREKQRGPKNVITPLDVSDLDVAPLLRAADEFLEAYADYLELAGDYWTRVLAAAWRLRGALDDARMTGVIQGTSRKVDGLVALSTGVRQLLNAAEQSPYAVTSLVLGVPQASLYVPEGEVFHFDAEAVKKIAFGTKWLGAKRLRRLWRHLDEEAGSNKKGPGSPGATGNQLTDNATARSGQTDTTTDNRKK
jgi:hypothetical protein